MKNLGLVAFCLILISSNGISQKQSPIKIMIGSNMIPSFGGTMQLFSELKIFEFGTIKAGFGFMPFGYFRDITDRDKVDSGIDFAKLKIDGGSYFCFGIKRFGNYIVRDDFRTFFGLDFNKWSYLLRDYSSGIARSTRFKLILKWGGHWMINENLGCEPSIGVSWFENTLLNEFEEIHFDSDISFNMGFNIFYQL